MWCICFGCSSRKAFFAQFPTALKENNPKTFAAQLATVSKFVHSAIANCSM
jgi:hypothetical protein